MEKQRDRSERAKKGWVSCSRRIRINIGDHFGRLEVLSPSINVSTGHCLWKCKCQCGKETIVSSSSLTTGNTKSCGCLKADRIRQQGLNNIENLSGQKFELLTVIRRDKSKIFIKPVWECRCECGSIVSVRAHNLKNGSVKSCGCLLKRKGENHPGWKGGKSKRGGYILMAIYDENNNKRSVSEHRFVMESKLGRKLFPNERVHHKNGKRDDNRLENLELWSTSHPSGQRIDDLIKFSLEILRAYSPENLK
jgi:hypothetical protein